MLEDLGFVAWIPQRVTTKEWWEETDLGSWNDQNLSRNTLELVAPYSLEYELFCEPMQQLEPKHSMFVAYRSPIPAVSVYKVKSCMKLIASFDAKKQIKTFVHQIRQ